MDVMISRVIPEKYMENITRQPKPTMIIHSFNHSKAEENYSCSCSHSRDEERDGTTKSIEQETLKWVIVKGPNCIGNNQPMMLGVDMTVQKFVLMHETVNKVLPCIHDKHCNNKLRKLNRN